MSFAENVSCASLSQNFINDKFDSWRRQFYLLVSCLDVINLCHLINVLLSPSNSSTAFLSVWMLWIAFLDLLQFFICRQELWRKRQLASLSASTTSHYFPPTPKEAGDLSRLVFAVPVGWELDRMKEKVKVLLTISFSKDKARSWLCPKISFCNFNFWC